MISDIIVVYVWITLYYYRLVLFKWAERLTMIIKKSLPREGFAKISNKIFTNKVLSHGAVRLYGYLCTLPNGKTFIDKDIVKQMAISQPMLTRWKRELKEQNLILVVMLAPRIYDLYIGHPGLPASEVKMRWEDGLYDS